MARAAAAARSLGAPALWLEEVDSTNAEARRRAEAGEAGPLWIAARRQTAGRGRRGRSWETGGGNLAATLLTVVDRPPVEAAQVAFVAALAVYDLAVTQVPEVLVRLKWPNDLLVAGRKASGILVESGKRDDGRLWLAVGVGVNLASPPVAAERPATCLKDHLRGDIAAPLAPPAALEVLAEAFGRWFDLWLGDGFEPLREAWTARAELGRPCSARLDHETVEGVAEALEADGALRLRLASGEARRITAGDVFFPDAA
jgi:BirA family transcriptional regulator, biotin operon repressor / biotin---[acetyl-CoA-carboxylase] ligase